MNRPTASASAKSSSAVAPRIKLPTISSDNTGNSATNEVDSERISTEFTALSTISPYVKRPVAVSVFWYSPILSNTTTVS